MITQIDNHNHSNLLMTKAALKVTKLRHSKITSFCVPKLSTQIVTHGQVDIRVLFMMLAFYGHCR